MGCGGSKDEDKGRDKPVSSSSGAGGEGPQLSAQEAHIDMRERWKNTNSGQQEPQRASDPFTAAAAQGGQEKMKQCREIVSALDESHDGILQASELRKLVKHLYPEFINVSEADISEKHPRIKPLANKTTEQMVTVLYETCDSTWVSVFHSFLGLGVQAELSAKPIPGVFKVVWEGGVRYRNSPNYTDIADQEQLALPGTEFEIAEFERGGEANSKLWYGYINWADYYIPVTFQDGKPMLERIGEPGSSLQLRQLATDLFRTMDADGNEGVDMLEITNFLDGAQIGYDPELLVEKFKACDKNGDNLLQLTEFIECYNHGVISNVFCIPTYNKNRNADEKDPSKAMQRKAEADAKAKEARQHDADFSNMAALPTAGIEHHAHLNTKNNSTEEEGARNTNANVNDAFGQNKPKPDAMAAAMQKTEDDVNPNASGPLGAFGAKPASSGAAESDVASGSGPMGAWG